MAWSIDGCTAGGATPWHRDLLWCQHPGWNGLWENSSDFFYFFFAPTIMQKMLLFLMHTHTSNVHESVSFPATKETLQFTRWDERRCEIPPLSFSRRRLREAVGRGGVGWWVRGGKMGEGMFEISAWTRKRINSIITKDYVHLGRGPPFSRRALTVKSLFCAPPAPRGTLKKVIMFPRCGGIGPPSSPILWRGSPVPH